MYIGPKECAPTTLAFQRSSLRFRRIEISRRVHGNFTHVQRRKNRVGNMRKQTACNWVLGCAMLCLMLWKGADAQASLTMFWEPMFCQVGGDAGWNIQQGNTTFLQNWADVSIASTCNVFVFTSAAGTNHTVNVLATTDSSRTAASVCQDSSLTGVVGRNHFTTNVSLIVLKFNVTYWFVSGVQGDCEAGLVFRVQSLAAPESSNPSPSTRDVGVAYNMELNPTTPQGSGAWAPVQPVFVTGTSQRTIFYGDALNGNFHLLSSDYQLHTLTNSGPATCTSSGTGYTASATVPFLLYSIIMFLNQTQDFDHVVVSLEVNSNTSTPEQICNAGTRAADVVVAQTADDCSLNPGAPYLCPPMIDSPPPAQVSPSPAQVSPSAPQVPASPPGSDARSNMRSQGPALTAILFVVLLVLLH